MKKVAIVYASHDGHTQHISERLCELLNTNNTHATLISIQQFTTSQLADYDFCVFGAPIRYGQHLPEMMHFLTQNQTVLDDKKSAFFSVNLTARKAHRNTPQTSNYIKKMFAKLTWRPDIIEVFAGKINYPIYRFFDKQMIRLIMWITKGPTDAKMIVDYTNWQQVSDFAQRIVNKMQQ